MQVVRRLAFIEEIQLRKRGPIKGGFATLGGFLLRLIMPRSLIEKINVNMVNYFNFTGPAKAIVYTLAAMLTLFGLSFLLGQ